MKGRGASSNLRLILKRLSWTVCASGATAINKMVTIAGVAISKPSRASANSWVARRGLAASTRGLATSTSLAALYDLAHLIGHLLDGLFGRDLPRHGLPKGGLNSIGRHVRIVRGDWT